MTLAALLAIAEGWQWVHRSRTDELNGVWTFVRDRTPEQVMAASGMKPSLARSLTWVLTAVAGIRMGSSSSRLGRRCPDSSSDITGIPGVWVPAILALFGIGAFAGLFVGRHRAWHPEGASICQPVKDSGPKRPHATKAARAR